MNAVLTVDPGGGEVDTNMMGNAELIIAHVEMLMEHVALTEVSTVELGGEAVAPENMQHAQKIYMEHAIQHAEMLLQHAERRMRLLENAVAEKDFKPGLELKPKPN